MVFAAGGGLHLGATLSRLPLLLRRSLGPALADGKVPAAWIRVAGAGPCLQVSGFGSGRAVPLASQYFQAPGSLRPKRLYTLSPQYESFTADVLTCE